MESIRYWGEIPVRFYSDLNQQPFKHCLICGRDLIALDLFYIIEKAYKSYQSQIGEKTLFEYAICLDCAESYREKLSKESRESIDEYMSRIDFASRNKSLAGREPEAWVNECLVHQEAAGKDGEVQIYGFCKGDQFCFGEFPYMIRAEAMDELVELISQETLDELDDFKNNLSGGPSELQDILNKVGPRLLI